MGIGVVSARTIRIALCKDRRVAGIALPLGVVLVPTSVPELERMANSTHTPMDDRMNSRSVGLDPFHADILQLFARILRAKSGTTDRVVDILLPLAPGLAMSKDFQLEIQLEIQLVIQKATVKVPASATAMELRVHNKCNSIPVHIHT